MAAAVVLAAVAAFAAGASAEGSGRVPALTLAAFSPDFVVVVGAPSMIRFNVTAALGRQRLPSAMHFGMTDYEGRPVGGPLEAVVSGGIASLNETFPSEGYFELKCTETGQAFGVIAAPPAGAGGADPRFAVVAGFTQIVNTAPVPEREPLLRMLSKIGVGRYRDFPQMGLIRPNASEYMFDALSDDGMSGRMDQLHSLNRQLDMTVLDCFVGTEEWNKPAAGDRWNRVDGDGDAWRWPRELGVESDGYAAVARRWGDTQVGIEVDNEADAAAHLPADQYAVQAKLVRYGVSAAAANASAPRVPVVCGAFTDAVHSAYLDSLCESQLASVCDVISYHSYTDPGNVQDDAGRIVQWAQRCAGAGRPAPPLFITESGANFAQRWNSTDPSTGNPRGLPRPRLSEDRIYATSLAAHQIENIVIGVATTCAFNYVYYEEGGMNYGMTGHERTPLRSLATYAAVIRFLRGKSYVGDLPNKDGPELRGRVFANAEHTEVVAAVFPSSWPPSGSTDDPGAAPPAWSWSIPILSAHGADGRGVHFSCGQASGCQWGNYDGLSWLQLDPDVLELIDAPTLASALAPANSRRVGAGYTPPPVIVQMAFDNATTGVDHAQTSFGSAVAYTVPLASASNYTLTLLVHNLHAAVGGSVELSVVVGAGSHLVSSVTPAVGAMAFNQTVQVPPGRGVTPVSFKIDLMSQGAQGTGHFCTLVATATGNWGLSTAGSAWTDKLSMLFEVRQT